MVRSDLIRAVTEADPQLDGATAERIVDVLFEQLTARLVAGARVELRGFGMFSTRARGERPGRNPRTGEVVDVKAKRAVHFKPGKGLRDRIDASGPAQKRLTKIS